MIEENTKKHRNENASYFRNKGGRYSHKLLQENITLKKEIERHNQDLIMQIWNESNLVRNKWLSLEAAMIIAEDLVSKGITSIERDL